jgi:lipoprotein NlpI
MKIVEKINKQFFLKGRKRVENFKEHDYKLLELLKIAKRKQNQIC